MAFLLLWEGGGWLFMDHRQSGTACSLLASAPSHVEEGSFWTVGPPKFVVLFRARRGVTPNRTNCFLCSRAELKV